MESQLCGGAAGRVISLGCVSVTGRVLWDCHTELCDGKKAPPPVHPEEAQPPGQGWTTVQLNNG